MKRSPSMPSTDPYSRRGSFRRRSRWVAVLAALAIPATVFVAPAAHAADGPYSIDGSVPDPDTVELSDVFGSVKELGPVNASDTKIGVIHKASVPMLGLTNPNGQVDLRRAWLDTERDAGTQHDWLYFAWERDANSGSGFIAYEFMKNPAPAACTYDTSTDAALTAACNPWANRTAGDFIILWDQQGGSKDLFLRTWSGAAPNLALSTPVQLNAGVSQAAYSTDGFRGEAAVDLTATVFAGSTACQTFANTIPSTVTGNSDQADYKDTILKQAPPITNCTSSTVTTPQTAAGAVISAPLSIGTGVVGVRDSAVVGLTGGTGTPAGSVTFTLCKVDSPGLCTTTTAGTAVGSTNLSGTSYPATVISPTAYVTSAGRYCWRAVFSGDATHGIPASSDARANECFTVAPVTPTLATTAGPGVTLGTAVTDSAVLAGTATQPASPVINLTGTAGAPSAGTITFRLYGPGSCATLAHTTAAVAVSGNGTYGTPAPQHVPTAPGTYSWVASYSGSSPNTGSATHNATCTDASENVTVSSVPSSLTSAQAWIPNDAVTVGAPPAGSGSLAGTVSFALYATNDCTGAALYSVDRTVAGTTAQTATTANTTARTASGTFSWLVSYDSTNPAQRDIPASCHETSLLTIANGGTVSSPAA